MIYKNTIGIKIGILIFLKIISKIGFPIWSIQGQGAQMECLAPKSISKHYFELPLHLQNNLWGSLDIHIVLN